MKNKFLRNKISLSFETAIELGFLLGGLEAAMAEFGGCVDELELDILQGDPGGLVQQGLSQGDNSLLWTHAAALYHEVVVFHDTIVREPAHWGNVLLGPEDRSTFSKYIEEKNFGSQ